MRVKRPYSRATTGLFTLGVLLCVAAAPGRTTERGQPTEVLVVGTIHDRHEGNANYSYEHLARILDTFDPDAICVEIRPEDFRRKPYLKEMHLATVWALSQGKRAYPIDWWGPGDDRKARAELAQQPEFKEKQARLDQLRAASPIIGAFEKKYGDFYRDNTLGYRFWNGGEFAQYFAESYRLELDVYGDSPLNLHYLSRNAHMMDLIRAAIRENPGRKVAVLTGCEHKHFFDRELGRSPKVHLVRFESILPLTERPLAGPMQAFLDEDDDLLYYEKGAIEDFDQHFSEKLIPLVHGPDMDVQPEIIPRRDITVAERILERWQRVVPQSDARRFEEAWLRFLCQDYSRAIELYSDLASKVETGSLTNPFYRSATYVNLGRCYDLLGEREKALAAYRRVEAMLRQDGQEAKAKYILQDYLLKPYQRPGAVSR